MDKKSKIGGKGRYSSFLLRYQWVSISRMKSRNAENHRSYVVDYNTSPRVGLC